MSRISIAGPFYFTHFAEIDAESAEKLIDGSLDRIDWRYEIQDLQSYRSLYGAIEPEVSLDDSPLFGCEDGSIDQWVAKQQTKGDPMPGSDEMFLSSSCNLSDLPKDKYFYICCEICEGDESREFNSDFDESKLSVRKVTLSAGRKLQLYIRLTILIQKLLMKLNLSTMPFMFFMMEY